MIDFKHLFSKTKEQAILVAEDYHPLCEDLADVLQDLFQTVEIAENGEEALEIYRKYMIESDRGFDILMTDIQMPKMNGIELCQAVRRINPSQEIIVLSAHTDSEYLIELINCGIAQFINKPIEQHALMKALFHVSSKNSSQRDKLLNKSTIHLGDGFMWNRKKCELTYGSKPVDVTRYEYLLLNLLVNKEGQVCTNEEIVEYFYEQNIELPPKSIRNLVFKLRKKLPDDLVQSIYGMGYKLNIF